MRTGPIDVGRLTLAPAALVPETAGDPPAGSSTSATSSPLKVNGTHLDSHLSVGERLAQQRQRRRQPQASRDSGQQEQESSNQKPIAGGVSGILVDPLNLTLDLIHELTHNQRQYRPDKETGGVNVSILHLPEVVGTSLGRIKARVPVRCGIAPIVNACVDWGLRGLGQYPAVQRLLWLKAVFNEREEAHRAGYELEAGLARSRSGRSLYGLRGQCLQEISRNFPAGLPESKWRENVYMPMDTYTDLKEVLVSGITGLGLEIQDAVIFATMYTLIDVTDITAEEDRLEMKTIIDNFLDHVQVRGEAFESMMRGWGMLESREETGK